MKTHDFVVLANRLPVDRDVDDKGRDTWRTSPGGLVSALHPIMRAKKGAWIGWHGAADEKLAPFEHEDIHLIPVELSAQEVEEYYEGFSNATLWPLYHDVIAKPEFHREWWDSYVDVNQRFAKKAAKVAAPGAIVWIQDYQLQLVPELLRGLRPDLKIGFFLHIPFPPVELFNQVPWRRQILEGLLGADLVGFQLPGGAQNFLRLVRARVGYQTSRDTATTPDGRTVKVGAFPISINSKEFEEMAKSAETEERAMELRARLGSPKFVFLGIDRLDYTKGLAQRLRAFGELVLEKKLPAKDVAFVQVAPPSRERVDQYRILRDEIDRLVGRINGEVSQLGTQAITYLHTSFPREEMVALYRAADVMIVTPLRDGMNLVAKEYVAARYDNTGALVLSEFAGAAAELKQAYIVNPYDINGMKAAIVAAVTDPEREREKRMRAMRRQVMENDVDNWAKKFLDVLK